MKLRVDLRDQPIEELDDAILRFPDSVTFVITAWQLSAWAGTGRRSSVSARLLVMAPDFLYYARLASTGRAGQILKLPASTRRLIMSGLACIPTGISQLGGLAKGQFWAAAEAMTAYDLGLIPRSFGGEVSLHYNLTDFACFFERESFMRSFQNKARSGVTWGIATQQIAKALSLCSRWNVIPERIIYTIGYSRSDAILIEVASRQQFANTRWTIDLTQWPQEMFVDVNLHDFPRKSDDEWLVSLQAANDLMKREPGLIN